jgi:hypothetical protein
VVLANGTLVKATSTNRHADLFWALRGAGQANLGVVTRYAYRLHQAEPKLAVGTASGLSPREAVPLLVAAATADPSSPKAFPLDCHLELLSDPDDGLGIYAACAGEARRELDGLGRELSGFLSRHLPHRVAHKVKIDETPWKGAADEEAREFQGLMVQFWNGFLLAGDCTPEAWSTILEALYKLSRGNPHVLVDIELRGGAISRVDPSATAFPWRDAAYAVGVGVLVPSPKSERRRRSAASAFEAQVERVGAAWDAEVAPRLRGTFVNYAMSSLREVPAEDAARLAWGDNLPRLEEIKARYDPNNVFRSALRIPVKAAPAAEPSGSEETGAPSARPASLPTAPPFSPASSAPTATPSVASLPTTDQPSPTLETAPGDQLDTEEPSFSWSESEPASEATSPPPSSSPSSARPTEAGDAVEGSEAPSPTTSAAPADSTTPPDPAS